MRKEPEARKQQLIFAALATLAEQGVVEFTLNDVAGRAEVSPGLILHYFGDKEALLEAAFRAHVRRLNELATARMAVANSPRARIEALVDAHLGQSEFALDTARVWLSLWGQALYVPRLARVQRAHQRRMLSNLRHDLRQLVDTAEVQQLAETIAAMIDGVWLRSAMSGGSELESGMARTLIFEFLARHIGKEA